MLVSIIIVTYNSEKYILETLNSIKEQSFKEIELIITDDYSNDNTLNICEKWITENKIRFDSTAIIKAKKNTGISGNCNRGLNKAHGEWIKFVAGDDILHPDCIRNNIEYINLNKKTKILFSNYLIKNEKELIPGIFNSTFYSLKTHEQFKYLLKMNPCNASTVFINRECLIKVGSYDQKYKMIEDYPLWLKLTKMEIHLDGYNINTVIYRKSNNSIQSNKSKKYIQYKKDLIRIYYNLIIPELFYIKEYSLLFSRIYTLMIYLFNDIPKYLIKSIVK